MSAATMNGMDNLRKAAEILVEKNDAANEKNRQLILEVERMTKERDAALEREQALAAHAEKLKCTLKLARNTHGVSLMTDPPKDAWKHHKVDEAIADALTKTPTTSLARRDLIKQAEVLEGCAHNHGDMTERDLRDMAAELRPRAASLDVPR